MQLEIELYLVVIVTSLVSVFPSNKCIIPRKFKTMKDIILSFPWKPLMVIPCPVHPIMPLEGDTASAPAEPGTGLLSTLC